MSWQCLLSVEGARGRFKAERQGDARLALRSFAGALRALRDAASGQAQGRRQHQPVAVTKEAGAATPQFAEAACTAEVLRSALFEFVRRGEGGAAETVLTVRLVDATVSGHRLELADAGLHASAPLLEHIEFAFRRIEWEHRPSRTVAADEW